jgi:multicomponent Na+:H+ antiporter subunit E
LEHLLALAWAALSGEFTLLNLGLGFVLGFAILLFVGPALGSSLYFTKASRVLSFLGFFVRELALSNFRVAYDVITPRHHMKPALWPCPWTRALMPKSYCWPTSSRSRRAR